MPIGALVKLCYSGKYDLPGMLRHINGEAGLMAYLGTTDIRAIMKRIDGGDETAPGGHGGHVLPDRPRRLAP